MSGCVFLYYKELITMLKACKYCGRIHSKKEICSRKPIHKRESREDKFRNTTAWRNKREEIKKRDRYLCQACLNNLRGTVCRLNTHNLSVHHIKPLKTNFELRLDNSNLITLCSFHHEMAEKNSISAAELMKIIPPTVSISYFKTSDDTDAPL